MIDWEVTRVVMRIIADEFAKRSLGDTQDSKRDR